jgi:hypothetical protein
MSQSQHPPLRPYHPATFEERGVAIPFTTPLLSGTRARPTPEHRVELVVPNPSGGRGVYIIPWHAISTWCQPTLHDAMFNERIANLQAVTPSTIRRVGLEIAAEGLAGEAAMDSARAAAEAESGARLEANYRLLMTLVQQVGLKFLPSPSAEGQQPPGLTTQARLTVDWVAPRIGQSTIWMATALESLSDVMGNIGVGQGASTARMPHLLALLRQTRLDMADWSEAPSEVDQAAYVRVFCRVADLTLSLAQAALEKAQALTGNMVDLLRTWAGDPKSVIQLVMRTEWLLDGWEQICLIWNYAKGDVQRRGALVEIVALVPVLPKEVGISSDNQIDVDKISQFRRLVALNEDWRSGSIVFELLARNEHLRAMTCAPY